MRRKDRELNDKADLVSILDEADVCRIAIQTGKAPYIVPLNFGYTWDESLVLYFHSATEGRKLDLLAANSEVGFELDAGHKLVTADLACSWGMKYRSIVGTGRVRFIDGGQEKLEALTAIMKKYEYPGIPTFSETELESVTVFCLVVEKLSGKQKK